MHNQISKQDFTTIAVNRLYEKGVDKSTLSIDKDQFSVLCKDELGRVEREVYLGRCYALYNDATSSAERQSAIDTVAQIWFHPVREITWDEAKSKLRVVIRDRRPYHRSNPAFRDGGYIPQIEIGDHLTSMLAIDGETSMTMVSEDCLQDWNVDFGDAINIACENIRQTNSFEWTVFENPDDPRDCLYIHENDDEYGSSILVFPDVLGELEVLGELVIFTPRRDTVLVTGSDSMFGLEQALNIIEECQSQITSLIPEMLSMDDNHCYYSCRLPEEHPFFLTFLRMELEELHNAYADLKDELSSSFDQLVHNKRIVNFRLYEGQYDAFSTATFMRDEGSVILPVAEYIGVADDEGLVAMAAWDHFSHVAADKLVALDCYPKAYELVTPLTAAEIRALGFHPKFAEP